MTITYQKKWLILLNQPKKKPPEGGYFSIAVWSGWDVGISSFLPQVPKSQCYLCALQCVESSQCYLPISINQSRLPHFITPLTIWNARQVQVAVADCCDCRFWFCHHWCWFWLRLPFMLRNKSVPQNIGCQAHSLPTHALVNSSRISSAHRASRIKRSNMSLLFVCAA